MLVTMQHKRLLRGWQVFKSKGWSCHRLIGIRWHQHAILKCLDLRSTRARLLDILYVYLGSQSVWCFCFAPNCIAERICSIAFWRLKWLHYHNLWYYSTISIAVSLLKQYAVNTILIYLSLATVCESHHWSTSMINVDHQTILLSTSHRLSIARYLVNAVNAVSWLMLNIGKGLYPRSSFTTTTSWFYHSW